MACLVWMIKQKTRKLCHSQSYLSSTLRAHALSAGPLLYLPNQSHPTPAGPEFERGHRRGQDDLLSVTTEAQRARGGHSQARARPGSGAETNLGSRKQPQGI